MLKSLAVCWRPDLSVSITLRDHCRCCFGENHSCGRVGKELIIAFPQRRPSHTMQMTKSYRTVLYFHHTCILLLPSFSKCVSLQLWVPLFSISKCPVSRSVFIFHFHIVPPTHIRHPITCCHLVAMWQHYSPGYITLLFGLCNSLVCGSTGFSPPPVALHTENTQGAAYLCTCS